MGVDAGATVPPGHPLSLLYGGGSDTSTANQLAVRDAAIKPLGPAQDIQGCRYLVEARLRHALSMLCVYADGVQATASNIGPVLPAFAYGMNLQLVRGQPQMPMEPFRILTTCSWEQNAYTVKIYVPLHGVKTDLLRAVFQPHTLDIKAINLQVSGPVSKLCLKCVAQY